MALFESYERRIDKINAVLNSYGIASIEEAEKITKDAGLDVYNQVKGIQPICFENACWAYIVGAAIAIKKDCRRAADAAAAIGEGLQAFCIPGSVADQRKVGLGHGNLGKMLLEEETDCFAFLAGHESFAAAEGAIGIAEKANKVRKKPLRVILNGLGKDAAKIISRINGFTYVQTEYDYYTGELKEVSRTAYSDGLRSKVNCYGANDVREGVAIMWKEGVDVSITGNSTNPTRFQHPVAGTFKKVFAYILIGVGIGAMIHNWIPETWIESILGSNNPFGVILATLVGIPMYADIFGTIPVAEALLAKGAELGTILSFMMAVTTLSLPSLIMLKKAVKPKLLTLFIAICTFGIIIVGYLFNFFSTLFM